MNLEAMIAAIRERADRTRCRPLNVFVSSTFRDLRTERRAVRRAILGCGCLPRLAEEADMRPGGNVQEQIAYWLRDAQVLVLLVATRYGELAPSKVSWTEEEVRAAAQMEGLRLFPYFLSPKVPPGIEPGRRQQNRLEKFRRFLVGLPGHCPALAMPPQYPTGRVDLQLRVARDLGACQSDDRIADVLNKTLSLWRQQVEEDLQKEEERRRNSYDESFEG